jgi:hypothetical protein
VPAWGPTHEDLQDDDSSVARAAAEDAVQPMNKDDEGMDNEIDTDEDVLSGCSDGEDNELIEEAETVALADMYWMSENEVGDD